MSFKGTFPVMIGAWVALSACTRSPQGVEIQPQPGTNSGAAQQTQTQQGSQQNGSGAQAAAGAGDSGAKATTISGSQLPGSQGSQSSQDNGSIGNIVLRQSDFANYDTSALTYKFTYLTYTQGPAAINFTNGAYTLTIQGLPAGLSGNVVLEIYDGPTLVLRGETDNVTLAPGSNTPINLVLKAVGGSTLTVNVSTDPSALSTGGGGTAGNPPTTQPSSTTTSIPTTTIDPSKQPSSSSTVGIPPTTLPSSTTSIPTTTIGPSKQPSTGTGLPPTSTSDPIASWDGRSFLGNSSWNIVPVQ
jgi:hypothetical protein